ncbi:MAG: hypothetical protein PVH87_07210 [Desulfobacteraceae bacterium]|jgi:glutamate synthase domain-containing protein 1
MKALTMQQSSTIAGRPSARGLYDPRFEHDACGVGMVCRIQNTPSHRIIEQGLEILKNLSHRGACGCDARTGDGAGILMQSPHQFFKQVCQTEKINLPRQGRYGGGLVFLPVDREQQSACQKRFEAIVGQAGQKMLGWRKVPVCSDVLGHLSRHTELF